MSSLRVNFFALREDILPVLEDLDRVGVQYLLAGMFENLDFKRFTAGTSLPELGKASFPGQVQCRRYLAAKSNATITPRRITLNDGSVRFAIDQLSNPDSIIITAGGAWGSETIISGEAGSVSKTTGAKELMNVFRKSIKKRFVRVKAYWVGPQAHTWLQSGKRLTGATQSPREYDLRL
jgi:hypothetical protein